MIFLPEKLYGLPSQNFMEKMFCAKKVMKLLMKVAYILIYFSKLFLFYLENVGGS
jgi:hypothetical protein